MTLTILLAIFALVAVLALAPLLLVWRRDDLRGRREAALALHRAQRSELDRDLAEGRIGAEEYRSAMIEVERRLLAAGDLADEVATRRRPALIVLTALLVPVLAGSLYLVHGQPGMPDVPLAARRAADKRIIARAEIMIGKLRARLATMPPNDSRTRAGWILLGNAENSIGHAAAAADAWGRAVNIQFDPTLAALAAEAATRAEGHVSPHSADLFRRALAAAPPNAPWLKLARQRLAEAKTQTPPAGNNKKN